MFKKAFAALSVAALAMAVAIPSAFAHEGREVGDYELVVGFLTEPAYEGQLNGVSVSVTGPAAGHAHDATTGGVDLEAHGAIFASGTVDAGGSYSYVFGHDLAGLEVPYHDHLTGFSGTVMVTDSAETSGTAMVVFTYEGFSPSELHVQPDTTVMFMNSTGGTMTALSGLHDAAEVDGHVAITGLADSLKVEVAHLSTNEKKVMDLRPVFGQDGKYAANFVPTAPGGYSFRIFGEIEGQEIDETFTSGPDTFDEALPAKEAQFPVQLAEARELQDAVRGAQTSAAEAAITADDAGSQATLAMTIGIIGLVAGVLGLGLGGYAVIGQSRKK
jgi:hypothetical protein